MRVTVDIDPILLAEAMRVSGLVSRRQVIQHSLSELIRHRRVEELQQMGGSFDVDLDLEGLERLRADN